MKPVLPVRVRKVSKAQPGESDRAPDAMKTIPAAKILKDFGAATAPGAPHQAREEMTRAGAATGVPSLLSDAHARGIREGRAAALAEAEARFEEQQRFYEKQLELERCTWAAREAEKLAEQLSQGLGDIKHAIAGQTARILKPFLIEQVHRQAINELCEALEAVLATDQGMKLEVSGPEDLLQLLREKLSDRHIAAVFSPAESVDVRVSVGQTILETRLGAWMAKLEEIAK